MRVTERVSWLLAQKAIMKAVFRRSYCSCDNLICLEKNKNGFSYD